MTRSVSPRVRQRSRLFLIGGAADSCLAEFVRLAGGQSARILILPHASEVPAETAADLSIALRKLGPAEVSLALPGAPLAIPAGTTALYLTGGDQSRLVNSFDCDGISLIRLFLRRGGLVAGTSAGAAAAGINMITGGMKDGVLRPGALKTGTGLGLLSRVVVDTHFAQRKRFNRLVAALIRFPGSTGIGLDEDTAVYINGTRARVFGAGQAWVYRTAANTSAVTESTVTSTSVKAGDSFRVPQT